MGARGNSWWFFYAGFRGVGRGLVRRRLRLVPILVAIDPAPVVSMNRVLRPGLVLICKHWRGRAADVGMRWWSRVKRQGGWKALSQESHHQPSCHEATACPRCYIPELHHVSQRAHLLRTALARPARFSSQRFPASEAMCPSVPSGRGIKSVPGGPGADDAGSAARGSNRTTSVASKAHLVLFAGGRSSSHHNRKPPLQLLLWFQKNVPERKFLDHRRYRDASATGV